MKKKSKKSYFDNLFGQSLLEYMQTESWVSIIISLAVIIFGLILLFNSNLWGILAILLGILWIFLTIKLLRAWKKEAIREHINIHRSIRR